ncbi:MAG: esterase-like activity of phytase family protein [Rhizobiaceae bacterium]|nr:esterase-like activity of phytase family protein [Rhizobiaceae bacterium]
MTRLRGYRWLALAIPALIICALIWPTIGRSELQNIAVETRPVSHFQIGQDETRFGKLEFVGGLELTSDASDFGSISAFRFTKPGTDFIAVADTGFWVFGTVVRDADMRPAGFTHNTLQPFADAQGMPIIKKWLSDAEGLAIRDGVATVGFEREHRLAQYRIEPGKMGSAFRDLDFLVPRHELRLNRGFEAVTHAPSNSPLEGAIVIVSERSLDPEGNMFGAVLAGLRKGVFTVKRHDPFDVTDGAFLPDGDLLLLERSYSVMQGVGLRLRRISGEAIKGGARALDGPILLEADMAYQIDNMEAMDVWQRSDGATIISLMSDDNQSILQRNLYLEFRLLD